MLQIKTHYGQSAPTLYGSLIGRLANGINPDGETFDYPAEDVNEIYRPHIDNMARVQIFYGGSSSGKSVFCVGQRPIIDTLLHERNYLVCRQVAKDNRRSTFVEVKNQIYRWGLADRFSVNETQMIITADTGYQILFAGLDDVEKTKSIVAARGAITDIVVEEATQTDQEDIKQLMKRQRGGDASIPKRLTLLFNPILRSHWIYKEYFKPLAWDDKQTSHTADDLTILKTWYIHNRFLTPGDIHDLETEPDEYFKSVYTFGNWGVLGDLVFTNWETADLSGMAQQFTNRRAGLDFGYNDVAAAVDTHYDQNSKTIYIYRELYEDGLTNDLLATAVRAMIDKDLVTCDSAEPKSIAELRQHGVNARGAKKGRDSVNHGIQWLKQQRIIIDKKCVNTINEFLQYHWEKDRHGEKTGRPVDKLNHAIDALRYAYENDMVRRQMGVKRYR